MRRTAGGGAGRCCRQAAPLERGLPRSAPAQRQCLAAGPAPWGMVPCRSQPTPGWRRAAARSCGPRGARPAWCNAARWASAVWWVSPRRCRAGRAGGRDAPRPGRRRGRVDRVRGGGAGSTGLADRVGESEEVIGGRLRLGVVRREADDLPAAGGGQAVRVLTTQVVGVRLRVGRQRAQDCRLVGVDVRQGGDRGAAARRLGAPTGQVHSSDFRRLHGHPTAATP